MPRHCSPCRAVRGFTLIEMLIVVAIAVILMAIALPTVKYALDDAKIREGSRQVNAQVAVAKALAASTRRGAGLVFLVKRVPSPNPSDPAGTTVPLATDIFLAKDPPPYAGGIATSRIQTNFVMGSGFQLIFVDASNIDSMTGPQPDDLSRIMLAQMTNPNEQISIQFDFKGHVYSAIRDGNTNVNQTQFYINDAIVPPVGYPIHQASGKPFGSKYQIFRGPQAEGKPLKLPPGTALDLVYSGTGPGGNELSAANSYVRLMFSPSGEIRDIHYDYLDMNSNLQDATIGQLTALHLLLGRVDKVGLPLFGPAGPSDTNNLSDQTTLWVSIGRRSGSVRTTENLHDGSGGATALSSSRKNAVQGQMMGGQ